MFAVGACALVLAVEDNIRQSRGSGGAMCAQMNIFERVVRIVRVISLLPMILSLCGDCVHFPVSIT